jgi:alpha-tubulin suppressor-like RCC1 family protein
MKNRKMLLGVLLSSALVFSLILPASVAGVSTTMPLPDDCSIIHSMMDNFSLASAMALNMPQGQVTPMVAAGYSHVVGLKSDGTVVAVGWNYYTQCYVGCWTDIIQVAAGRYHTVGVKSDGTVVTMGWNQEGQCNVGGWTNTTQVAASWGHTVGLKTDGTVVAVGNNRNRQCSVDSWVDIIQVAAGGGQIPPTAQRPWWQEWGYTLGLKSDGTVVAVGDNSEGQCSVGGWMNITQVAAGTGEGCSHTLGLKSDGTVVAVGDNSEGQCNVGGWMNITPGRRRRGAHCGA